MQSRIRDLSKNFLKKCGGFFYRLLIEPKSPSEDNRRHEFILNSILTAALVITALLYLVDICDWLGEMDQPDIPFVYLSALLLFFGLLLLLSRKKKSVPASYLLIVSVSISATYAMYRWGAEFRIAIFGYVLAIAISGILLGTKKGFLTTILLSASMIVMAHLQYSAILVPDWSWKLQPARTYAEQFSAMFFLIMTISWLSNREMGKSLARARASEQTLRQERDRLEITVQEKMADLRHLQMEKMSQLYRLAEFGRMSSGFFHDLINPFSVVALHIDQMGKAQNTDAGIEAKNALRNAVKAGEKMRHFLSSIEKQIHADSSYALFSLNNEIEETVELLGYRAKKSGVQIEFSAEKEYLIEGNPLKFSQAMLNIITNAIDSYRGMTTAPKSVLVHISESEAEYLIEVTDRGCGIAEEHFGKIFDPFFTTKLSTGMGLGLSTAQDCIVREFGGTVSIRNNPSTNNPAMPGSTLRIRLPKIRSQEECFLPEAGI